MSTSREQSNYEIASLVAKIRAGSTTQKKVQNELERIGTEFPEPFMPTSFTPKPKPWDKRYLEELADGVMFGKSSREYLLYVAAVADEIFRPIRILKVVIGAVVAITAIVLLIFILGK